MVTTLVNFNGTNGQTPEANLVQGTDGNIYGVTPLGGVSPVADCTEICGTFFSLTPDGTLTTIYTFCSLLNCVDGYLPTGIMQAADGNFYGTTFHAAVVDNGTIFKITPAGVLTVLYTFTGQDDGCAALSGVVQASDGNFYGTTTGCGANGWGTVFKMTPTGGLSTLHAFCAGASCQDGASPGAALVQAPDGNLYGTTEAGGTGGGGTVFKISLSGQFTKLADLCTTACEQNGGPRGPLIWALDGNFYGMTYGDGGHQDLVPGTLFKVTAGGTLTTLESFCSQPHCVDGLSPLDGLTQGSKGDFYGTTYVGGATNAGVLFKVTSGGAYTRLFTFDRTNGSNPQAGLLQDTSGIFYGSTTQGGTNACGREQCGTLFAMNLGLPPFVTTRPAFGPALSTVRILGTDLSGASQVTFNGQPAAFTVVSPSLIAAAVPAGASSGRVQVTLPGGVLTSNANFVVVP